MSLPVAEAVKSLAVAVAVDARMERMLEKASTKKVVEEAEKDTVELGEATVEAAKAGEAAVGCSSS